MGKAKVLGILMSLVGLLDSLYLLVVEVQGRPPSFCDMSKVVNCGRVEFSPFSHLFGVPDPVLGIGFFLTSLVLWYLDRVSYIPYLWVLGVTFVGYFVFTEWLVGSICVYCTLAHVMCVAQIIPIMGRGLAKRP